MKFIYEANRIYINDDRGQMIAEITFPLVGDNIVDLDHTYVSNVLRGQGIAGKLMEEALKVIEKNGGRPIHLAHMLLIGRTNTQTRQSFSTRSKDNLR